MSPSTSAQPASAASSADEAERLVARRQRVDRRAAEPSRRPARRRRAAPRRLHAARPAHAAVGLRGPPATHDRPRRAAARRARARRGSWPRPTAGRRRGRTAPSAPARTPLAVARRWGSPRRRASGRSASRARRASPRVGATTSVGARARPARHRARGSGPSSAGAASPCTARHHDSTQEWRDDQRRRARTAARRGRSRSGARRRGRSCALELEQPLAGARRTSSHGSSIHSSANVALVQLDARRARATCAALRVGDSGAPMVASATSHAASRERRRRARARSVHTPPTVSAVIRTRGSASAAIDRGRARRRPSRDALDARRRSARRRARRARPSTAARPPQASGGSASAASRVPSKRSATKS